MGFVLDVFTEVLLDTVWVLTALEVTTFRIEEAAGPDAEAGAEAGAAAQVALSATRAVAAISVVRAKVLTEIMVHPWAARSFGPSNSVSFFIGILRGQILVIEYSKEADFADNTRIYQDIMEQNMEHDEPTLSTRRIHEGRIINLREDTIAMPSGRQAKREIVEHKGAVCVVPVLDDGRLALVRQYRKPAEEVLLEIPAGGLEAGEEPVDAARRELIEECGLRAATLTPLWSAFLAPGYSTELIHCFLAEGLTQTDTNPDEDEIVETELLRLEDLLPMIDDGRIRDAKTISGLLSLYRRRNDDK